MLAPTHRGLRVEVEFAQRFNFVPEELEPNRFFVRRGRDDLRKRGQRVDLVQRALKALSGKEAEVSDQPAGSKNKI